MQLHDGADSLSRHVERFDEARWRRRMRTDLALVAASVMLGAVLVVTNAVEGTAGWFQDVLGDRVDEVYFALFLVLIVVAFAGFRRWQEARYEYDQLQKVVGRLRQTERWRAALMSTLAHDIRSPLTAVEGSLQLLEERGETLPGDRRQKLVAIALRQTRRVEALTADLLAAERIEEGVLKLSPERLDLVDVVRSAMIYTTELDVELDIPPDIRVEADPRRLEQIVINLITNARRHGAPPIVISAEQQGDMVAISIRDHGTGAPTSDQADLFQRFTTSDRDPDSVGLGLWIVQQLTQAHQGEVRYEDAEPGARFVVMFPAPGR